MLAVKNARTQGNFETSEHHQEVDRDCSISSSNFLEQRSIWHLRRMHFCISKRKAVVRSVAMNQCINTRRDTDIECTVVVKALLLDDLCLVAFR